MFVLDHCPDGDIQPQHIIRFIAVIYSFDAKADCNLQQPLLLLSVSHNPLEIILKY